MSDNDKAILAALSDLYNALSNATSTGLHSDPVLQPSVRAALRICLDRLYATLEVRIDGVHPSREFRFRTMASAASQHGEVVLTWLDQKTAA